MLRLIVLAGKPANNIVDANLSVLRERIQQVRKSERLTHTCGWNYKRDYDHHRKFKGDNHCIVSQSTEIVGLACGAIGLVFLVGSLSIYLVSLFVYICI